MTPRTRVLVTGASVAGPAAAYWLAQTGCDVTVLEAAPTPRAGGQNVDVRASGRDVLRLMGLEEAVRGRNTGEVGTRFEDESGRAVSEFPVDSSEGSDGPTAELEILRGALSEVVVAACPASVDWRFGDRVVAVAQDPDGVSVSFDGGESERFDLLVVAEGVGSRTRSLVFGSEPVEKALGMYTAYGTIPRTPADDDWWRWLIVPGARQASLRPDDEGTIRANLSFRADSAVLADLPDASVRAALRSRFAGVGWEVPRILDGFDTTAELYVDHLRQVRCPGWHRGRVVLLGDAAWCVTPIGGGGTSLALTGAYVLAAFLSSSSSHEEAFAAYETWMRPLVKEAQDLPPGVPRIATPSSRAGVQVLRWATKVAALPPVIKLASRFTSGPRTEQELPRLNRGPEPGGAALDGFDLRSDRFSDDPGARWRAMRETCPVAHSPLHGGGWLLSRYDDITGVALDPGTFSSRVGEVIGPVPEAGEELELPPISTDPPDHAAQRKVLMPFFTKQAVSDLEQLTRDTARDLVDRVLETGAGGAEVDAVERFTQQIPIVVTARMLGLPDSDRPRFRDWTLRMLADSTEDEQSRDEAESAIVGYFEQRLEEPAGSAGIMPYLRERQADDPSLTDDKLLGMAFLMLIAGIDTTYSALGAGLWHLARTPADRRLLAESPSLIPNAVEELLRVYAPTTTAREVTKDVRLGERSLRAGDRVLIPWAAANRDPWHDETADEVRLDRDRVRHVAFGVGVHRCPGAGLAQMELRVALEEWLRRIPDFELTGARVTWSTGNTRGPESLPLRLLTAGYV